MVNDPTRYRLALFLYIQTSLEIFFYKNIFEKHHFLIVLPTSFNGFHFSQSHCTNILPLPIISMLLELATRCESLLLTSQCWTTEVPKATIFMLGWPCVKSIFLKTMIEWLLTAFAIYMAEGIVMILDNWETLCWR